MDSIKTNPWKVETLDVYLYYCCPECDHKSKTKTLFVNHAFASHPEAKNNLKYEEVPEDIIVKSDITIKEEWMNDIQEDIDDEFNNQSLDWYEPEIFESSEKTLRKKRGRPSKHASEGKNIF